MIVQLFSDMLTKFRKKAHRK